MFNKVKQVRIVLLLSVSLKKNLKVENLPISEMNATHTLKSIRKSVFGCPSILKTCKSRTSL